mgnify:CR=1 FL=1
MKISILTPDLSHNCLGRAYLLAKILQRHYEVEIIGPRFGDGIWEPVANDKSIKYKSVKIRGRFKPYWQIRKLANKIDGDVIYASKPVFTSFGLGLLKKISDDTPLILDIDDWQMGFIKRGYKNLSPPHHLKYLATSLLYFYGIGSYWSTLVGEKLSHLADEITVSNDFLKEKFGGTIVSHGRDTEDFNPEKFNKDSIRMKYKIRKNRLIIMFFGTPLRYKGIEDLIESISLIKDQGITLAIIGINYKSPYCLNIVKTAKERLGEDGFIDFGLQPFDRVPEFLAMADVVAIPQRKNFATIGQMPAKVFDAMAMAKPIIATNVSDLPEILNGCGWIVEPENPKQLAKSIQYVLDNPKEAKEMGQKARKKCIEKYSWDAMEEILLKVFKKYE